ncbi:MAG: SufD family Fe-S cluster assembly protein [Bacilli bacterium]|nr:SufD family Fe-S cluster assembly protein [Bacilli bacterium]
MTNITLKNNEKRVLEYKNFSDVNLVLNEGSELTLKLANFEENSEINITGKIGKYARISVVFADFSSGNSKIVSQINLAEEGATCDWHLATLANKKDNKIFDISFKHLVGKTTSLMDNYGVARDDSKIVFSGVSHITEGAKGSNAKQNAKIIVFDKNSQGVASPILKIDENEVQASHGAIVGQLNSDHMFYLMSRGLTRDEARMIITLGYLKPVSRQFSEETQKLIEEAIKEAI